MLKHLTCSQADDWTRLRQVSAEMARKRMALNEAKFGYFGGGVTPSYSNVIDNYSFSVDGNVTDVGDLVIAVSNPTGAQY